MSSPIKFTKVAVIRLVEQLGEFAGQELLTLAFQLEPTLRPDPLPATDEDMLGARSDAEARVHDTEPPAGTP
jgi:hypothetical protein